MNSNQTKELYQKLNSLIEELDLKNKCVVIFGVNLPAYKTMLFLNSKKVNIHALIDNKKYDEELFGLKIKNPEEILLEFNENVVVLIASQYYIEMLKQLKNMGYIENKHVFSTLNFKYKSNSVNAFKDEVKNLQNGYEVYSNIIKRYGEKSHIIMLPYSALGDSYFISSYLYSYFKKNNVGKYVITVIGGACKKVIDMFGFKNVELLTQDESDNLMCYGRITGYKNIKMKCLTHNLMHTDILRGLEYSKFMDWGNIIKNVVLDLDELAEKRLPETIYRINYIEQFFKENSLKKGRTVILSPYANTLIGLDMRIWNELVSKLRGYGLCVCTNSIDDKIEPVLENTRGVFFPVVDASSIIETAGYFIGLRSGLCDIVSNAKAKKIVVYPTKDSTFFSINAIHFGDESLEEVIYEDNSDFVDEVIKKMELI